jgi:hypothetical protein
MRARYALVILLLVAVAPFARAQDASYALTATAAEEFVRVTQQLRRRRNVSGANVKLVLRPLQVAWEQVMLLPAQWSGMCESAKRYLRE